MSGTEIQVDPRQAKDLCVICGRETGRFWAQDFASTALFRCSPCDYRWMWPRQSQEVVGRLYDRPEFGAEIRTSHIDLPMSETWLMSDLVALRRIVAYSPVGQPRLLDVGSSYGHLAITAKLLGFEQVSANDACKEFGPRIEGHGIRFIPGDIRTADIAPVDVVTAHHVIEHVDDPVAFVRRVRELLVPDGLLHVYAPNTRSFICSFKDVQSRLGLKAQPYKHLACGHHRHFFSKRSLRLLLENNGFEVVGLWTQPSHKRRSVVGHVFEGALVRLGGAANLEAVAKARP